MTKISHNPSFPKRGISSPLQQRGEPFPTFSKGGLGEVEVKFQVKRPSLPSDHIIRNSWGFTLFEIVMALLILAIAIVPMMNAFAPALLSTSQGEEQAVLTGQARRTMNRLLDIDFRSLDRNRGTQASLVNILYNNILDNKKPKPTDAEAMAEAVIEAAKESFPYLGVTYDPPVVAICATSCAPNASCVGVPDCVTDDSNETRRGPLELTVTLKTVTLQTLKANR